MSNPKVWNPNLTFNAVPGSLALDTIDLYVSQSINGVTGGAEAPVSPIIIGGAGIDIAVGSVPSGGTLTVASGGAIALQGKMTLSGNGAGIRKRWGDVNNVDAMLHTTSDVYLCAMPSATRTLTLAVTTAPVPQDGESIDLVVQGALVGQYDVYYEGSAQPLVTDLGSATNDSMASFVYRASTARWYLAPGLVNGTVGTNAA